MLYPIILAVLAVVAVCAFVAWMRFKTVKSHQRMREARLVNGNWMDGFREMFVFRTVGGFHAMYELTGTFKCVDPDAFKLSNMFEPANHRRFIDLFNHAMVVSQIQPAGPWLLSYHWTANNLPFLAIWVAVTKGEDVEFEFDPNGCRWRDAANAAAKEQGWNSHGCSAHLFSINKVLTDDLIKKNYAMLSPEQRAVAEKHVKYLLTEEIAVVAALKRRLDLLEPVETHRQGELTVHTTVVGQAVKIEWQMSDQARKERFSVRGFRKEGGFHLDKWSENANGELVVDSFGSGSAIDHPPSGSAQFYTFMLTRQSKAGETERQDALRFQIRIPNEDDVKMLKQILDRNKLKAVEADAASRRERQMLEQLEAIEEGVTRMIMSQEKRDNLIAKIRGKKLSNQDEDKLVDLVNNWYENQHDSTRYTTFAE